MYLEQIKLIGRLSIVLTDAAGNLKDSREVDNLVVTTGKTYLMSRALGITQDVMSHMAVGTGGVAAAATNTTLGAEAGRVALTSSTNVTTTTTGDSVQYVATFPAGTATGALTEAGIFNAAAAGILLCRTVFGVITKTVDDALTITWKVTAA